MFIENGSSRSIIGIVIASSLNTESLDTLQRELYSNITDINDDAFKKFVADVKSKTKYSFNVQSISPGISQPEDNEEKEESDNPDDIKITKGADLVRILPTLTGSGEFKIKADIQQDQDNKEYIDLSFSLPTSKGVKEARYCSESLLVCSKYSENYSMLTTSREQDKTQVGSSTIFNVKLSKEAASKLSVFFTIDNQLIDHGYLEVTEK